MYQTPDLRRYGKRNASNPGRADVAGFEVAMIRGKRDPKPVARGSAAHRRLFPPKAPGAY